MGEWEWWMGKFPSQNKLSLRPFEMSRFFSGRQHQTPQGAGIWGTEFHEWFNSSALPFQFASDVFRIPFAWTPGSKDRKDIILGNKIVHSNVGEEYRELKAASSGNRFFICNANDSLFPEGGSTFALTFVLLSSLQLVVLLRWLLLLWLPRFRHVQARALSHTHVS